MYNDAHYHIPSVVIFSSGKTNKHTKMVGELEQRQISEIQTYIKRQKREDQRERTSYIDYLYFTSLLCNLVLRKGGDEALSLL